MVISFKTTREQALLIVRIADRADRELFVPNNIQQTKLDTVMDLSACIANGCPLKLADLLAADASNFGHDLLGIRRHLNHRTGQLENCFIPRFAE